MRWLSFLRFLGRIPPPCPENGCFLRLYAPGALSPSSLPGFLWMAWPAAAAGKWGQSTVPPAPDERNDCPGSVPRNGGRADRDWCAGAPRSGPPAIFGSFHRWKEHEKGEVPPLRRRVPLPAAAKEPKRRFLEVPLWLAVSTGGQNLSGLSHAFRATGPWRGEVGAFSAPWGRLAFAMLLAGW